MVLFQEVLPPELLDLLVLTLCRQAPAFSTSLGYAKLVTAMLTVYQSQVSRTLDLADLAAGAAADQDLVQDLRGLLAVQLSEILAPLCPRSPQPTGAAWLLLWIRAARP